ncbi:hypothetical protein [Selenomonas sp. TAMA-11512]|uniref:hypothetical protein n=1 Tax=Selenomonas sp. TAMA-11512 TaxID=3095337 RepID=UPI0030CEC4A2
MKFSRVKCMLTAAVLGTLMAAGGAGSMASAAVQETQEAINASATRTPWRQRRS